MSERVKLHAAVPHLPVDDALKSIAFYRDKLGLKLIYDDEAVGFGGEDTMFACLARDSFWLCVNWHDDSDYKFTMDNWVDSDADLQALHAEFTASGAKPTEISHDDDLGLSAFTVTDPDGHEIVFSFDHDDA